MKFIAPLALLLLMVSCNNPAQRQANPVYYDVAGYVDAQITALSKTKPTVSKRAQMGGKTEQLTTHTLNWSRELELFKQADINKPALRQSYTIARPDSLTYRYTLKPGEKSLTVRSLTVQLDAATQKPRRIEATLANENPLYTSEKQILLESGPGKASQWGVRHYRLQGFQHLAVSDKSEFEVEGVIE